MTIAQREIDQAQVGAFAGRVLGDVNACMTTLMAALGDQLGLFKALDTLERRSPTHAATGAKASAH